jgi:hypothetical protein
MSAKPILLLNNKQFPSPQTFTALKFVRSFTKIIIDQDLDFPNSFYKTLYILQNI